MLTAIFIIAKLIGLIHWSWWWIVALVLVDESL